MLLNPPPSLHPNIYAVVRTSNFNFDRNKIMQFTHYPAQTSGTVAIIVYLLIIVIIFVYFYQDYTMKLSDDEKEELGEIMMEFYKDPDYNDFMIIWDYRKKLIAHNGRPVKYWLWGVYRTQPQFFSDSQKREFSKWIREIERGLRRAKESPNTEILDCIWSLYFATGSVEYSEIVRRIANGVAESPERNAARWSYRSIMKKEWCYPADPSNTTAPAPWVATGPAVTATAVTTPNVIILPPEIDPNAVPIAPEVTPTTQ